MNRRRAILTLALLTVLVVSVSLAIMARRATGSLGHESGLRKGFRPRHPMMDTGGYEARRSIMKQWKPTASLPEIAREWDNLAQRGVDMVNAQLADPGRPLEEEINLLIKKAAFLVSEGDALASYKVVDHLRAKVESSPKHARLLLASTIFLQGVTAMRRGENDNCIMCRGESSCIFPISLAAVHTIPTGSRLAIKHFREYLEVFPDDLGVRWLLNLAHMTLGEYPDKVDPRFRLDLDRYFRLRIRHRPVPRRQPPGGPRSNEPGGGSDHG